LAAQLRHAAIHIVEVLPDEGDGFLEEGVFVVGDW
jgi:hypothetical protein